MRKSLGYAAFDIFEDLDFLFININKNNAATIIPVELEIKALILNPSGACMI